MPAPAKKTAPARKAAPRKRTARETPARPAAQSPAEQPAAPAPAAPESLNRWLHGLVDRPLRVEVFDRWWELKMPTPGRADAWDSLVDSPGGVELALASMMFDPTPAEDGAAPGTARAREFLELAYHWVPAPAQTEFWRRFTIEVFTQGEASAS